MHSHQLSPADAFQRKPPKLEAHAQLVSNGDPRKQTTSAGPILTPNPKPTLSSALGLSRNKAKWALLPAKGSARDAKGSLRWLTCNQVQSREMTENGNGIEEKS